MQFNIIPQDTFVEAAERKTSKVPHLFACSNSKIINICYITIRLGPIYMQAYIMYIYTKF